MAAEPLAFRSPAEVHAWTVPLDVAGGAGYEAVLSREERVRAHSFVRELDRNRYARTRSALRFLLGWYLQVPPESLKFVVNRFGKPALEAGTGGNLRFNVSHSHQLAVVAVRMGGPVGVDVEAAASVQEYQQLVDAICTSAERDSLVRLSEGERPDALLRLWVLKEAYLKALGVGLSFPHQNVRVDCAQGGASLALNVRGRWRSHWLGLRSGYSGALVFWQPRSQLECRVVERELPVPADLALRSR